MSEQLTIAEEGQIDLEDVKESPAYLQALEEVLVAFVDAPQAIGQILVVDPIEPNLEVFIAGDLATHHKHSTISPSIISLLSEGGRFGQRQLSPSRL